MSGPDRALWYPNIYRLLVRHTFVDFNTLFPVTKIRGEPSNGVFMDIVYFWFLQQEVVIYHTKGFTEVNVQHANNLTLEYR